MSRRSFDVWWRGACQFCAIALCVVLVASVPMLGQAAGAAPEFEAATIKPVKDANPNWKTDREEGRRIRVDNRTLAELLMMAYRLDRRQIVGGPAWATSDTYDVVAVASDEAQMQAHGREMFQRLLMDRFGLVFHWEQREMPVYVMSVANGGAKMTAAEAKDGHESGCQHLGQCAFRQEDMQHFANWLQFGVMDKPVVDKTGLTGEFNFTLRWTPDESQFYAAGIHVPPPTNDPNAPPGLKEAMQEQLGLRLEAAKTQTQVMVIDKAKRPRED